MTMKNWQIFGIASAGVAMLAILILEVIGTVSPPGRSELRSIWEALAKLPTPKADPEAGGLIVSVDTPTVVPALESSRGWSVRKDAIEASDANAGGVDLRYTCTLPAAEEWFPLGALTGVKPDAAGVVWLDAGRVYRIRSQEAAGGIQLMFYEQAGNTFLRGGDVVHSAKQLNSEEGILVTYDKAATILVLRWASTPCKAHNVLVERLSEADGQRALAALPDSRKKRFR